METGREKTWIKLYPGTVTFLGIVFGIITYFLQTNKNLKEKFRQEIWMKKKDLYLQLAGTLGEIAAGPGSKAEYQESLKKFSALYYGNAAIFDDPKVDSCLTNISHTFFLEFDYNDQNQLRMLREQVRSLDNICREALKKDIDNL